MDSERAIISASRRTDLPAYYSPWLINRLKEGFAQTRNPMNPGQVRRVELSPDAVEALVIWTKNPLPLLTHLDMLEPYVCCFQFTLTSYGKDIEPGIPSKGAELIPAFKILSERFGKKAVIWRYDPIFINGKYTADYHAEYFGKMAERLSGFTENCTISFMDYYRCTQKSVSELGITDIPDDQKLELAGGLSRLACENGMKVSACAEALDLSPAGVSPAKCIDAGLLGKIAGREIIAAKDKNQRENCGCAKSVDIGAYNTCLGGCKYCYASHSKTLIEKNASAHDPGSPFL